MAEKETNKRPGKDQITEWKKAHTSLLQVEVGGKIIILRKPTLHDIEKAQMVARKKDKPNEFARNIISNCKLYEDEGMLSNDENMLAVITKIDEIVTVKEAEVKEL